MHARESLRTSTAALKSASSALELIWSTLCNGWNAISFASSNLIFCRCLKKRLDLMLTNFCNDWSINNERFEPLCNDRFFLATRYKDCSVYNWIQVPIVTYQMRIQEKVIWKRFVFGFYLIKNQKPIYFQKYFGNFFSVYWIKWVSICFPLRVCFKNFMDR